MLTEYSSVYSNPASVGQENIPLTQAQKEWLKPKLEKFLFDAIKPALNELVQNQVKINQLQKESQQLKVEYQQLKVGSQQLKVESQQLKVEGEQLKVEGERQLALAQSQQADAQRKIEGAQKLKAEAQQELAAITKENQDTLTKMFYAIFNGKKELPVVEINTIFTTYLADSSLTVEETAQGESFLRINSMKSVVRYLKEHQDTRTCDFRHFKAEVNDVSTLAEYLKTSSVKAIALKKAIPEAAKASLAEAVAARNGALKIQYFD